MIYGSVCSGIEAATVAWHPLGWRPAWFAEIDKFCCTVLKHHYPEVHNHGDFTAIGADSSKINVLVGGTPCQSFSAAGCRGGSDDPRGDLTLKFLALAGRLRPRWVVWENVPGVMSIDRGRTFGAVLGLLGELGYGFAYRVLDAQYFGVPQRRRRVFVVGCLGDWRSAAAVLLERHSLSGNPPPGREAREEVAGTLTGGSDTGRNHAKRSGSDRDTLIAGCLGGGTGERGWCDDPSRRYDAQANETFVAHTLRGEGFDAGEDGAGRGTPLVVAPTALTTGGVRRLTPRECERLQGFPDDYTLVPYRGKPPADGPRYRAIGNSMAVPVMRWIGERIQMVEDLVNARERAA